MSGGAVPVSIEQRLQLLERENSAMRAEMNQLARRNAAIDFPRQIWIAKTVDDGTGYPATGDTFAIIFQDGSFTRAKGSPASSYANRSASHQEYAKSVAGQHYTEGTYVPVFEENRQYWIADSAGATSTDKLVKISDDEPTGTSSTGQYLADQFYGHNATEDYSTATDVLLSTDTYHTGTPPAHTDEHIRVYWETDSIACYSAGVTEFLIHNGDEADEPQWATVSAEATSAASVGDRDLWMSWEWADAGTCKQLRTFLDASAQTGAATYDATEIQLLGHHSDSDWGFYEFGVTGAFASGDYPARIDQTTTPGVIDVQLRTTDLTPGFSASTQQYLGKNAADQFTWLTSLSASDTDYRVAINATDRSGDTGGYLDTKLDNAVLTAAFDATADWIIPWHRTNEGLATQKVEYFLDASSIPNYAGTEPRYLVHNNGQFEWGDEPGEDWRFRVSTGTAGTWTDIAIGEAVYTGTSEDLVISWDESPVNQLTLFIDASVLPGFATVSDPKYLVHEGGLWKWRDGTSGTDTDYRFEINSLDASPGRWDTKVANEGVYTQTSEDLIVKWDEFPADTATLFIDASTIPNWAISGRKYLTHYNGMWTWAQEPGGSGTDTDYRFEINSFDASPGRWDTKVANEGVYTQTSEDLIVKWDEYPADTATLFIDASLIYGWSGGLFPKHLGHDGTQWQWYEPPSGSGTDTDYRFKITTDDASPDTWSNKIQGEDIYASQDLTIDWDETPNDKATLFIDASAITGWSGGTYPKHLGHNGTTWQWYDPEGAGTDTDYRFEINSLDASPGRWDTKVANEGVYTTTAEDLVVKWDEYPADIATLFIDASTIPYFDSVPDRKYLTHYGGQWQWAVEPGGAGSDTDYRFEINSFDASPGRWDTKVANEGVYTQTSEDLIIHWDEYPADKATMFIDADLIPNFYVVAGRKYLTHYNGQWTWAVEPAGGGSDTDYRFSISGGTTGTWTERINRADTSYNAFFDLQVSWAQVSDNATLFIDARTPYNFDSVPDRKYLTHNGGLWEWAEEPCLVRMNVNMTDCNYLQDLIKSDQMDMSQSHDLLIDWEITGSFNTQQLQHFIDSDAIPNWQEANNQTLGNTSSGLWYWWDLPEATFLTDIRWSYDSPSATWYIQSRSSTAKVIGPVMDNGWANKIPHQIC